jgi:hypothetical protein
MSNESYIKIKKISKIVLEKRGINHRYHEELINHAVCGLVEKLIKSNTSYEDVLDDSKFNYYFTIISNLIVDKIRSEMKHTHSDEITSDSKLYADVQNESNLFIDDIINKFDPNSTEFEYLILKSYTLNLDIEKYLNSKLRNYIDAIESRNAVSKPENVILDLIGIGYSGNTKARTFKKKLRDKLATHGFSAY